MSFHASAPPRGVGLPVRIFLGTIPASCHALHYPLWNCFLGFLVHGNRGIMLLGYPKRGGSLVVFGCGTGQGTTRSLGHYGITYHLFSISQVLVLPLHIKQEINTAIEAIPAIAVVNFFQCTVTRLLVLLFTL